MASNALLACLGGAVLAFIAGYATGALRFYGATFGLLFMTIPVAGTFGTQAGWPRKLLTVYTSVLVLLLIAGLSMGLPANRASMTPLETAGIACLGLWLIGIFAFGWIANGLAMAKVRK